MTKNLKKGQRIGRNPKTGTSVPISPRRVMFKPSAAVPIALDFTSDVKVS